MIVYPPDNRPGGLGYKGLSYMGSPLVTVDGQDRRDEASLQVGDVVRVEGCPLGACVFTVEAVDQEAYNDMQRRKIRPEYHNEPPKFSGRAMAENGTILLGIEYNPERGWLGTGYAFLPKENQ